MLSNLQRCATDSQIHGHSVSLLRLTHSIDCPTTWSFRRSSINIASAYIKLEGKSTTTYWVACMFLRRFHQNSPHQRRTNRFLGDVISHVDSCLFCKKGHTNLLWATSNRARDEESVWSCDITPHVASRTPVFLFLTTHSPTPRSPHTLRSTESICAHMCSVHTVLRTPTRLPPALSVDFEATQALSHDRFTTPRHSVSPIQFIENAMTSLRRQGTPCHSLQERLAK